MSNRQAYLKNEHPELRIIGGIGEFAAHLPALPVPDSIAYQYDTEEMKAAGWEVKWIENDHSEVQASSLPPEAARMAAPRQGETDIITEQAERYGYNPDIVDK